MSGHTNWGRGAEAVGSEPEGKTANKDAYQVSSGQGGLCSQMKPPQALQSFVYGGVGGVGGRHCTTQGCIPPCFSNPALEPAVRRQIRGTVESLWQRGETLIAQQAEEQVGFLITGGGAWALCDDTNLEDLKIRRDVLIQKKEKRQENGAFTKKLDNPCLPRKKILSPIQLQFW